MSSTKIDSNLFRFQGRIDVEPYTAELNLVGEELFLADQSRQKLNRYHAQTQSIFPVYLEEAKRTVGGRDLYLTMESPHAVYFPLLLAKIRELAFERSANLKRVAIVRLQPHGQVLPHIDNDANLVGLGRYHLALTANGGDELECDGQRISFEPGDLWWFNNKRMHSARNGSDSWRIHVIFDLEPWEPSQTDRETIKHFFRERCVRTGGGVHFEMRELLMNAEHLETIAKHFWQTHAPDSRLVAKNTGASKLAAAFSQYRPHGVSPALSATEVELKTFNLETALTQPTFSFIDFKEPSEVSKSFFHFLELGLGEPLL